MSTTDRDNILALGKSITEALTKETFDEADEVQISVALVKLACGLLADINLIRDALERIARRQGASETDMLIRG